MPSAVPIPTAVALAVRNCPYRWRTNSSPGLSAQATRVSRKSDPGEAMAYMLKRQDGFRGPGLSRRHWRHGPLPSSTMAASAWTKKLVENAIRSPAMNRRNALFAGHDEGGRNWARVASLIGTCKTRGVEPYA